MQGLHKSDNTRNNRLSNLYWGTPSQNAVDAVHNGDHLDAWAIRDIRELRERKVLGRIVAAKYGISEQMVCDIFKGRCYSHL
ncbi:HNH endonuclease [Methylobacterium sp. GXF4]|nr:HNH endonuclease [Methylobacterium sp. GXF4]